VSSVTKVIEITASSDTSFEDAVSNDIEKASESIKNITSAWVQDESVKVKDGKVTKFRVVLKVTFVVK
tara:strand:+ start:100 stop:303 length:204 start_codon:yes stop_codon:yes gene_type:complete